MKRIQIILFTLIMSSIYGGEPEFVKRCYAYFDYETPTGMVEINQHRKFQIWAYFRLDQIELMNQVNRVDIHWECVEPGGHK